MKRTRVLQVTHDMIPGGLPRVVDTLCRTIDRDQFEVSVLCIREGGALAERLESDLGVPVHILHDDPSTVDRTAFLKVRRFLTEHPADVLHTHNTEPFIDGTVGALLAGVRTVVHTDHARAWPDRLRYRVAEHLMSRYAYRVVGCSEAATEALRRYEWIPERKLLTIPNGIQGSAYDIDLDRRAKRDELGLDPDDLVLGFASRLEHQKNASLLLRAFKDTLGAVPNARLLIVGQGTERPMLEELSVELELGDRVRFMGIRLDIPELLQIFDVHVLPSRWEGLPMVLLESMAAGCPTVATAVGGVPRAIEHGVNGELVPSEDQGALAGSLIRVLENPGLRHAYSQAVKETFRARYDAAAMTRQYEQLYLRRAEALRGTPEAA